MSGQAPRWIPPMGWGGTLVSFGAPAVVLYVTTHLAIPSVTQSLGLPPIVWFMTFGAFYVLGPLAVIALLRLRGESLEEVAVWRERLRFRPLSAADWRVIAQSLAITVPAVGAIYFVLGLVAVAPEAPAFLANSGEQALARNELMLAWVAFTSLSIVVQEALWRGVYLPRQERVLGDDAWIANALGWALFHFAFGLRWLLVLSPLLLMVPFVTQKRGSSSAGATFHALAAAIALATAYLVVR